MAEKTEEIIFRVQGSAPEPYVVVFKKAGNSLMASCTCAAGEMGQICKHRIGILEGSAEGIVSANQAAVKRIGELLGGTSLEAALSEVRKAEDHLQTAKKELTIAKKKLSQSLL